MLWFSENLIRYLLHVCLREVKNNLFSFKHFTAFLVTVLKFLTYALIVYKLKFKDTDFFLSPSGIFVSGARDGAQLAEKGTNANYGGSAAERGVGLNLKVWIKVKGNWMGGGHLGVNSVK